MLGSFSSLNEFADGEASGGVWSPAFPLANLLPDERYKSAPARCLDARDLAQSQFQLLMPEPRVLTTIALLFHTMSPSARYRITGGLLDDTAFSSPTLQTPWRWVYPSLYDPVDLRFGVENFISGTFTMREIRLINQHLFAPLPLALVQRFKIEIDDQLHPDGFFDIGGAFGAAGFTPKVNFDHGRELGVIFRDVIQEAPSGRRIGFSRQPRRYLSLNYAMLEDAELRRFIDAQLLVRSVGTVLFIPNLDDAPGTMREAFPATFAKPQAGRFNRRSMSQIALAFEEVLA